MKKDISELQMIRILLESKYSNLCEIRKIESRILDHIKTHKYLINEKLPLEVNFDEAMFSWLENVYEPMISCIKNYGIVGLFKNKYSELELFARIQDHLHYIHIEYGVTIYPVEACRSYVRVNVKSRLKRLFFRIITS